MKRVAACAAAVLMLAACAKGGSNAAASAAPAASSRPASAPVQNGAQASDGARVYATNCSSCHQANGEGSQGMFPPLAGNPVVVGNPAAVIYDVKYGLNGRVAVGGKAFDGTMPAWSQLISDAEIASVVTYIRSAWGNKASAVTTAQVNAVTR